MHQINRKIIIILLLCITPGFCLTLKPPLKKTADRIIGMLINCEFTRAMACSDSLMDVDSTEPLYPYLHLCALGLRDLDFDRIIDTSAFLNMYDHTIKTIHAYEKIHGKTSYSMTLLGFAYASHSSFYLVHRKYFSAIGTGLDAVRLFNDIKKIDSLNYDAEFFLGFYNYARGELKKRLWMVLFWYPGSKKQGLRSLEACTEYGQLTAEGAKMVLIDIYVQESKYEKSRELYSELQSKYPRSRFLFWSDARYYEEIKEYTKAAGAYKRLARSYESEQYGDYNALVTRHKQIELLEKAGQKGEAARVARQVLADDRVCEKGQRYRKLCRAIRRYCKD